MRDSYRVLWVLLLFGHLVSACSGADRKIASPLGAQFAVPTKDDLLWVDGRRLSLDGYAALRSALPVSLSKDYVIWVAIAALAIQNDSMIHGREIPLPTAVDLARYAQGDVPLTQELESYIQKTDSNEYKTKLQQLINRSSVQRNPQVLAEVH